MTTAITDESVDQQIHAFKQNGLVLNPRHSFFRYDSYWLKRQNRKYDTKYQCSDNFISIFRFQSFALSHLQQKKAWRCLPAAKSGTSTELLNQSPRSPLNWWHFIPSTSRAVGLAYIVSVRQNQQRLINWCSANWSEPSSVHGYTIDQGHSTWISSCPCSTPSDPISVMSWCSHSRT